MKKLILLFSLLAAFTAHAQIKLSQPDANHIQVINGSQTKSFTAASIIVSIDTISVPSQVAIYMVGSQTPSYGSSPYNAFYINGVMANSAQQVAAQIRAWQPTISGGGGGSANPYPGVDYATAPNQTNGNQKTQVTALPSLPSGLNNIGTVSVTNNITAKIPNATTVTTTSSQILASNTSPGYADLLIYNQGLNGVWIAYGVTATIGGSSTSQSLYIAPGGYLRDTNVSQAINAISVSGTTYLLVQTKSN